MDTTAAFNAVDVIAAIFLLVCLALGFRRGLVGQIAPIIGLIVIAATVHFGYTPCRDWLTAHVDLNASVVRIGALVIVIGVPLIVVMLFGKLLGEMVKLPILSGIDRVGGAVAGLIAGIIFVLIVFSVLIVLPQRYQCPTVSKASWIGRHVACIEDDVIGVVSQKVDRTEGAILKAREDRANRHEKWE